MLQLDMHASGKGQKAFLEELTLPTWTVHVGQEDSQEADSGHAVQGLQYALKIMPGGEFSGEPEQGPCLFYSIQRFHEPLAWRCIR